jgi:hypothetical protein
MMLYYDIHINDKECKVSVFYLFCSLFPASFNDTVGCIVYIVE